MTPLVLRSEAVRDRVDLEHVSILVREHSSSTDRDARAKLQPALVPAQPEPPAAAGQASRQRHAHVSH